MYPIYLLAYINFLSKLRNISAALYVYDVSDEDSFISLSNWYKTLNEINGRPIPGLSLTQFAAYTLSIFRLPSFSGVVVGNKIDLKSVAAVDSLTAAEFARLHELSFVECSASDNIDVSQPFDIIAKETCKLFEERAEALKLL